MSALSDVPGGGIALHCAAVMLLGFTLPSKYEQASRAVFTYAAILALKALMAFSRSTASVGSIVILASVWESSGRVAASSAPSTVSALTTLTTMLGVWSVVIALTDVRKERLSVLTSMTSS